MHLPIGNVTPYFRGLVPYGGSFGCLHNKLDNGVQANLCIHLQVILTIHSGTFGSYYIVVRFRVGVTMRVTS
jgi:hypothetical protein